MSRRMKHVAAVFAITFAAAQMIRSEPANPATDASRTIRAHVGTTSQLAAVLDRSCGNCHSNTTAWPGFTRVAPLSWLVARSVNEARRVVNFSEWTTYGPDEQRTLLRLSCDAARNGRMPGPYAWIDRNARLSAEDIATICAAAR